MKGKVIRENMREKRKSLLLIGVLLIVIILGINSLSYIFNLNVGGWGGGLSLVSAENEVCCEKTDYGAWCMTEPQERCDSNFRTTPTSCESTSYCKGGCCYDSKEGVCMENTPQVVCEKQNGTWADDSQCNIPQCNLGCCVLGDQAAFVTLTRCKRLSNFYGLNTDFRNNINDEISCISLAGGQIKGACVYEEEFDVKCKMTTRGECLGIKSSTTGENGTEIATATGVFHEGYLCSAEELGTVCGPTKKTTCVDGRDEVFYLDSCGNVGNIYDAGRYDDALYWTRIIDKVDSCGYNNNNANSGDCGNCDYLLGSICSEGKARYGDYVCQDLGCKDSQDGEGHLHGESWCIYDAPQGEGDDVAGSRHWRYICVAGEEIVEPCADFRQEVCVEDNIDGFSQAACAANRWRDCVLQETQEDCENIDKRDCIWKDPGVWVVLNLQNELTSTPHTDGEGNEDEADSTTGGQVIRENGYCIPMNPPGFNFWGEGNLVESVESTGTTEAESLCSIGSYMTNIKFEKKGDLMFEGDWEVKGSKYEVWVSQTHRDAQADLCISLGDCSVGKYGIWEEGKEITEITGKSKIPKDYLSKGLAEFIESNKGIGISGFIISIVEYIKDRE